MSGKCFLLNFVACICLLITISCHGNIAAIKHNRAGKELVKLDRIGSGASVERLVNSLLPSSADFSGCQVIASTAASSKLSAPSVIEPNYHNDNFAALKMVFLFTLWYTFNAAYNVYNAYMKKDFQYPWASATLQLFVGLFYVGPLFLLKLRKLPKINLEDFLRLLPIACLNAGGHACTVNAMFEKGGGSFTHVIKASEPVVSVLLTLVVNGVVPKPLTAFSLLPVTYGVAYASTLGNLNPAAMSKEFSTKAAKMAMASNFAFSMRSILRKNLPADFQTRTNLDPANEHAITTLLSLLLLMPFVLGLESLADMRQTISALPSQRAFWFNGVVCGLSYYLYNEMQNKVLGSLGPVPTAVGNTLKRVVIFVALYLFTAGETFPQPKVVGCAIAIAGCFSFAICDSKKV